MHRKQVADAGFIAVGTFSFTGWFVPAVLQAIGWVEWAQGLSAVFDLFANPRISWPGIYLFLTFVAVSGAAVNNWAVFQRWRSRRNQAQTRTWNARFEDAIEYVALATHFGDSLSET